MTTAQLYKQVYEANERNIAKLQELNDILIEMNREVKAMVEQL